MKKKRSEIIEPTARPSLKIFWSTFLVLTIAAGTMIRVYFPRDEIAISDLEDAVSLLESGEPLIGFPHQSEREMKRRLIKRRSGANTLVLGSSRVQTLSAEVLGVPWNTMVNAGVSSATLQDLAAFWQIWKGTGRPLERVIVFFDNWMLNEENGLRQWKVLASDYESFRQGSDGLFYRASVRLRDLESQWTDLKSFWSVDALRIAAQFAKEGEVPGHSEKKRWLSSSDPAPDKHRILPDGSHLFRAELRSWTADKAAREAYSEWGTETGKVAYKRVSPELRELATRLFADMKTYGVKRVQIVTPPYHPVSFGQVASMTASFEGTVREIASASGASFFPSSNPGSIGCTEVEFYDGHHPKAECVRKIIAATSN